MCLVIHNTHTVLPFSFLAQTVNVDNAPNWIYTVETAPTGHCFVQLTAPSDLYTSLLMVFTILMTFYGWSTAECGHGYQNHSQKFFCVHNMGLFYENVIVSADELSTTPPSDCSLHKLPITLARWRKDEIYTFTPCPPPISCLSYWRPPPAYSQFHFAEGLAVTACPTVNINWIKNKHLSCP